MNVPSIASLLGESGPFYRAVSIERDRHDKAAGQGYVLTPWLTRCVGELLDGLAEGATRRAWRIVGDFGVGKSALALALLQAMDPRMAGSQPAVEALAAERRAPRLYPLVLAGSRDGLTASLSRAIGAALEADGDLFPATRCQAVAALTDPFEAILALKSLVVASGAFDGLLLVIDEMGKFLEVAAANPDLGDVFRLQALAENAARSGREPLAILLVLHQGFQSYAEEGSFARRTEWSKIAERFDELIFDHPLSHSAWLLAAALNTQALPADLTKAYDRIAERTRALGWLGPRESSEAFPCYPIHPASVPVLARFFAAFGQNERSLFGFVASGEANSLRSFSALNDLQSGFYRLDHFFDYVSTSFGHRLISRAGGGEWQRIRTVLDGVADADAIETAVLKVVGILNLIDAPDLLASEETLRVCLAPIFEGVEVDGSILRLRARGLLFERSGRSGLRLWTSRRVDLTVLWEESGRAISARSVSRELSKNLASLPVRNFLLARRHSIERGTNRRFTVRLIPASALSRTDPGAGADGSILCVLAGNQDELRHARAWAKEASAEDPTVVAMVTPPLAELTALVTGLLQHRWIMSNAVTLQEDVHAAAEIERGTADIESRLVFHLEALFGLGGHRPGDAVSVFLKGQAFRNPPPAHVLISQLCDTLFENAPRITNELVNRNALTSAGAGARQRLIEAMFVHEQDSELGFDTSRNPPERALYLSVLRRGNVHRQVEGRWMLAVPGKEADPLRLHPALSLIEGLLVHSAERVSITSIYHELARKLGVRHGLAPLLLGVVIVANRHRIALYERGTYCPKVDGQAFMRILKSPDHFDLQWVSLEGIRADVFHRLASIVEGGDIEAGVLSVVTPLVRFGADLPFHVQRSSSLSQIAASVRSALLSAMSPVDLIFKDLPHACGVLPFDLCQDVDKARASEFVERLEGAIAELRACYPSLLADMRSELYRLLDCPRDNRAALRERANSIVFRIQEQALKTFALRIADTNLGEDAWIEALGGAIIGKPPMRWMSSDVALWRTRLDELASLFRRVEAAAFGAGNEVRDAVRLSLTHVDGREHAVVVDVSGARSEEDLFVRSIVRMVEESEYPFDRILAAFSLHTMEQSSVEREKGEGQEGAGQGSMAARNGPSKVNR